jgi:hypothetical protein
MATRLEILEKWHLLRPYLDRRQRILWAATEAEAGIIEDWRRDTLGPTRTGPVAFRRIVDFGALIEEVRFAEDSPLEGTGFGRCPPVSKGMPFHGGNRGSNPLGDANKIKELIGTTDPWRPIIRKIYGIGVPERL